MSKAAPPSDLPAALEHFGKNADAAEVTAAARRQLRQRVEAVATKRTLIGHALAWILIPSTAIAIAVAVPRLVPSKQPPTVRNQPPTTTRHLAVPIETHTAEMPDIQTQVHGQVADVAPPRAVQSASAPSTQREPSSQVVARVRARKANATTPASPSELALQSQAYGQALATRASDPDGALLAFQTFRRRWPTTPLRHEVDLQIIDLLMQSGRQGELALEARSFMQRHPRSPRAEDIRALAGK